MADQMRVKICGITNDDDAQKAVYYGAWALGFIFYKKSPRYISPSKARKIIESLPPFVTPVGVFVNLKEKAVRDICKFARITAVQFHGDEEPGYCKRFKDYKIIKAFRIGNGLSREQMAAYKVDAYLFDSYDKDLYGGSGQAFDWSLLKETKFDKPFILSGGLNAQNIREALASIHPFAVDVSSGVEKAPGKKDPRLMQAFFDTIHFAPIK